MTGYIIRGFKIRKLKEEIHQKEQLLIQKDSDIKILQFQNDDLGNKLKEYKRVEKIDSLYYSIYNSYEKFDF